MSEPYLRPVTPDDFPEIIDHLKTHMKASWSREKWARLFTQRWVDPAYGPPDYGQVIVDEGRIVGFLGVVIADREFDGRHARTGSITSMYLLKSYRGLGLGKALMAETTADSEISYTVIGASPNSEKLLIPTGHRVLDRERYRWTRRDTGSGRLAVIVGDWEAIAARTDAVGRRLIADHRDLAITPVWLETPQGGCLAFFQVKAKGGGIYWDALHITAPAVFAEAAQTFADRVLGAGEVLGVDRRFLAEDVDAQTEVLGVPYYGKSPWLSPRQQDHLYSEILVFDLKLA
ncbi:MAG: GNAT family N-acetyltransferase [Azospirillaceae bacterium]